MAMKNFLLQAAARQDCLYALFPYQNQPVVPSLLKEGTAMYPVYGSSQAGSWAERCGLATLKNIVISNNCFTALNKKTDASILTPLDMQNNNTSKTFIIKVKLYRNTATSFKISPLFTQGFYYANYNLFVFNITFRQLDEKLFFFIDFSFQNDSHDYFTYAVDEHIFDQAITVAVTYDVSAEENAALSALYINGQHRTTRKLNHYPWLTLPEVYTSMRVGIRNDISITYIADPDVAWAIIFDRALAREEIILFK